MITIYSSDHVHQNAAVELIDGKLLAPFEQPRRAEMVLTQVQAIELGTVIAPQEFGLEPILQVHDRRFVEFLQTAWDEWVQAHGEYDALPLNWATRTMRHDRVPETIDGKLSYYSFDAGTPITKGTWRAASAAANVALTGAKQLQQGDRVAFALCRPPGHHAAANVYGGYCFLNNAAIAAQALREAGCDRVAILDIDYHHGNGTQAIFYDRADVLVVSLHADPLQDFPYFLGFADERGIQAGEGYNFNYPLRWGTTWEQYQAALLEAVEQIQRYSPDAIVVSLGVDTFCEDPISRFLLASDDYLKIGKILSAIDRPALFVLEGGYAIDAIGLNAVNVLLGFENG